MKISSRFLLTALPAMLLLSSCMRFGNTQKEIDCYVPNPQCLPAQWTGTPYDTSQSARSNSVEYYLFESMELLNTSENEWGLSFLEPDYAVVTFSDGDMQRAMKVRMLNEHRARIESNFDILQDGSTGYPSARNGKLVVAVSDNDFVVGNSNIYEGELRGGKVLNLDKIGSPINYNAYTWESHPTLSPDGKLMIYASDLTIDKLGTQLMLSVRTNSGIWSDPVALGAKINTNCDEITPHISPDGKHLYFASSGHLSIGGYDIFRADIDKSLYNIKDTKGLEPDDLDKYFSTAKNMGSPLNTIYDEISPSTPLTEDTLLYYSSNQSDSGAGFAKGGFDIYVRRKVVVAPAGRDPKHEYTVPDIPIVTLPEEVNLTGVVFNKETSLPIPQADITVKDLIADSIFTRSKTDQRGKYEVKVFKDVTYSVTASQKDLFYETYEFRAEAEDSVIKKDIFIPEKLELRINFPTNQYNSPYKYSLDTNGVQTNRPWTDEFDILSGNLKDAEAELEKVIIIGHTDDVGSDEYNKKLSERRVQFVIKELVKRGVRESMLEGVGAGESQPLPMIEGETLAQHRKRLRRVEMQKIFKEK